MRRSSVYFPLTCLLVLFSLLPGAFPARAADKIRYYDIYLTGNRLCKQCVWRVIDRTHVELVSSRTGERGIYSPAEILGVTAHPVLRKLFYKSIHGVGLSGQINAPEAFDRPDLPSSAHP